MDGQPRDLLNTDLERRAGNLHMIHDIHNSDGATGIAPDEANRPYHLHVVSGQPRIPLARYSGRCSLAVEWTSRMHIHRSHNR